MGRVGAGREVGGAPLCGRQVGLGVSWDEVAGCIGGVAAEVDRGQLLEAVAASRVLVQLTTRRVEQASLAC